MRALYHIACYNRFNRVKSRKPKCTHHPKAFEKPVACGLITSLAHELRPCKHPVSSAVLHLLCLLDCVAVCGQQPFADPWQCCNRGQPGSVIRCPLEFVSPPSFTLACLFMHNLLTMHLHRLQESLLFTPVVQFAAAYGEIHTHIDFVDRVHVQL